MPTKMAAKISSIFDVAKLKVPVPKIIKPKHIIAVFNEPSLEISMEVKNVEKSAVKKMIEVSTPTKTALISKSPAASGAKTGAICTITTIDV